MTVRFPSMIVLAAVGGALWTLTGCTDPSPVKPDEVAGMPADFLRSDWGAQKVPVAHIIRRDYRLREGDSLEVIYHIRHFQTLEYRIKIQDVLEIRFPFNPDLNQIERVQSEGTLRLDLIGEVKVFDRTIAQVQKDLEQRYSAYLKNPQLTVSFKESNVNIAELKEAIKTAPRGQSRLVPIAPDGTISLPFVPRIQAAGLTLAELHAGLNTAYAEARLPELEVTVNLQQAAPMQVYVLGEVRIPGTLYNRTGLVTTTSNELTLLGAIAQAGGHIPMRAELSMVMLIRRRHLPQPQVAIINCFQLLENRHKAQDGTVVAAGDNMRYDIWLEDGDVIYVPTTEIAKRADYIEYVWAKSIRNVGGFTSSAAYTMGDAVNFIPPR
ncbi:MAG: polysaccharide biosynthesis/export family protein [Phycisphaerae bacterium]|nr:polysaccharide biosynthesis/export family protein [Phycisphaerae bacterium]